MIFYIKDKNPKDRIIDLFKIIVGEANDEKTTEESNKGK